MSVRAKILAGNLAIAVLAVGLSVLIAWSAIIDLRQQNAAAKSLKSFGLCLQIGGLVAAERSAWGGAMDSDAAMSGDVAANVDKSIAATDATLAAARRAILEAGASTTALDSGIAEFKTTRELARTAVQREKSRRVSGAQGAMVDGLARGLASVEKAVDEALLGTTSAAANLAPAVGLARLAQDFRNVNGSRSAILGLFVGGQAFPAERISASTELSGNVALLWQMQVQAVKNLGSPPKLAKALEHVRATVMTEGEQRYRGLLEAARAGQPPPLSTIEWRRWTTPMLTNALVMRDAALETAQDMNNAAIRDAWFRLGGALAILVIVGAVTTAVVLVLLTHVIKRLGHLTTTVVRLADDDLDVEIAFTDLADEIGAMAKALRVLRDNARTSHRRAAEAGEEQAKRLERAERLAREVKAFELDAAKALDTAGGHVEAMCSTAETMSVQAAGTVTGANGVAEATRHVGAEVQALAGTAVELSASIGEIATRISDTADQSRVAADSVKRGSAQFGLLAQYVSKIGDVVGLIQEIAGQTNLLALNATIEAARAGEAGQGFSVVAGEVKALAVRTTQATKEVAAQIEAIRQASADALASMGEIDGSISRITSLAGDVAASVEQQHAATEEISRRVQFAASGAEKGAELATGLAETTNQAQGEAERVKTSSLDVSAEMRRLRDKVNDFLGQVASLT
ncbi:methyl-accepting chemotaxis protein [Telmatospirillum sp.]|uniref:methyl-accepting chemotaxis protein n=1 Tax=Telmatospirillum sp. TaxID=2079197 RepID=UPI00283F6769|nr:methyl-accepting chemotaxis protein [Telmatospirillum sp.]MDR3435611.1 methyl-accepting chemotaxis protein [Telmatospirillum sp.]